MKVGGGGGGGGGTREGVVFVCVCNVWGHKKQTLTGESGEGMCVYVVCGVFSRRGAQREYTPRLKQGQR